MKIQPIVEGYGDVVAVPILLRRLLKVASAWDSEVARPLRFQRSQLATRAGLRGALDLSRRRNGRVPILVIMDSDDDCPASLGPVLTRWAKEDAADLTCAVVLAHREYEAWLLAGVALPEGETHKGPAAAFHPAPERPRDAKRALTERMGMRYLPTAHQAYLTTQLDLEQSFRRSRSFRKLADGIGVLLRDMDRTPAEWPPASWREAPSRQ